ncbi:homocitrate synthase/isopropylmalate synthase family protein [Marinicella litoralis]|uniref:2-isopropylmalate synthase n=1 Tax=Marinicella litoralis TaxID=644220 RepID=A0A4R6XLM1_9GAMM|nr:alpha-isopropylmalate synthase regulatory domain-containing protein [Marinicella litoralis]TDR20522.1 2-isopropylmalate synthase [Marinicella litoralis]
MKHIKIFDTTLRDGQQCPGAGMSYTKNIEYAQLASKINIDILEAGFPSASAEDYKIVNHIAKMYGQQIHSPKVAALSQLRADQVKQTIKALEPLIPSGRAILHLYLPVAPELMKASLGSYANDQTQILLDIANMIHMAVSAGLAVEFSPEAYSQMGENFDFTTEVISTAIAAGAATINCPDTIGRSCYLEGDDYFVNHMNEHAAIMKRRFPNKEITWSVHCHNDFGLALDNSMRAVFQGPATQVEGCFNGIGERAGNVALEQCIMYLKTFGEQHKSQAFTSQCRTQHIRQISDFVDAHMLPRQPHWPISGDNAAKHSSGGHTNAILKNAHVYQPFKPSDVGKQISFVFGPLSGSNHAQSIIQKHGYICDHNERQPIMQFIKDFHCNRRKGLTDEEFMQAYFAYRAPIRVSAIDFEKINNERHFTMQASVFDDHQQIDFICQDSDTATTALHRYLTENFVPFNIQSYRSESKEPGRHAEAHATISIASNNEFFQGKAHDRDIESAALKALVDACNQLLIEQHYAVQIDQPSFAAVGLRD